MIQGWYIQCGVEYDDLGTYPSHSSRGLLGWDGWSPTTSFANVHTQTWQHEHWEGHYGRVPQGQQSRPHLEPDGIAWRLSPALAQIILTSPEWCDQ